MKIAIPAENGIVSPHFGRCPKFTIVEIKDGVIESKEEIESPGHSPGLLPDYFSKIDIDTVVAGGMGMRAIELFKEQNIKVIMGVEGDVDLLIEKIIDGTLTAGESSCSPGSGKGYGLDKPECDHN